MKILVADIGGTSIKCAVWGTRQRAQIPSGKHLTPPTLVHTLLEVAQYWRYDVISLGFPGAIVDGKPAVEPPNLGPGWQGVDLTEAFPKPVRVINDAAMQALGSYTGGRMLFLGLGTALGSTLILDDVVVPLELGELRYSAESSMAEVLAKEALRRLGAERWEAIVHEIAPVLTRAFRADHLVLGGGNAAKLKRLPPGARLGSNTRAFLGGARLWQREQFAATPKKHTWVLR